MQRAREFAARLVEYDRSAAQRTTVIDDQGDFFEVDSNAWLTPEERDNFKKQQILQDELERQRRAKVTVSIDLLGREVGNLLFRVLNLLCNPNSALSHING